ncbi:hypothetical protein [Williamsia sp. 1135]|uniref:hypothetical protein n=1 Tax=Williamsia sp. 1135 TaxID=1889262 RepID=UPI001F0AD932|nr:hypothetical protein [Williamsia sp. 1135]
MRDRKSARRLFLIGVGGGTAAALALEPIMRRQLADRDVDLGMLQLRLAYNTGVGFSVGQDNRYGFSSPLPPCCRWL